ncbi:hypothetical protein N7481_007055 [Penicillium waksmanii]|uniref:uncharacterized protein n=1 Tax=Penicillium waksmanii TaxID=69791 RepID=UPI002547E860|nr:uncharacterized protein N7481_007055 [Penicillium waksmanii]KAJ5979757.1 hypothetical protein N7481_007055 [Penicillium waksmanii]
MIHDVGDLDFFGIRNLRKQNGPTTLLTRNAATISRTCAKYSGRKTPNVFAVDATSFNHLEKMCQLVSMRLASAGDDNQAGDAQESSEEKEKENLLRGPKSQVSKSNSNRKDTIWVLLDRSSEPPPPKPPTLQCAQKTSPPLPHGLPIWEEMDKFEEL